VLSFPLVEVKELRCLGRQAAKASSLPRWELGDIVISLPRAKAQSKKHGITLRRELDLLLVHGILHLLGLDHERSPREKRKMRALERELTGGVGLLSAGG
jgi:probable rRNA maturation factor